MISERHPSLAPTDFHPRLPAWAHRFVRYQLAWRLTWLGWLCLILAGGIIVSLWYFLGESFLSETSRLPADVLVVDGWIGLEGIHAAAAEFTNPAYGYRYVVTVGGNTASRWDNRHGNYAEMARGELIRAGIPADRTIKAPFGDDQKQRTFASANAVSRALQDLNFQPKGLNVFTLGPHAARSRLVFAKVFGRSTKVGVIGWRPADYTNSPWWQSSERAKDLLVETIGFFSEFVFDAGRRGELPSKTSAYPSR